MNTEERSQSEAGFRPEDDGRFSEEKSWAVAHNETSDFYDVVRQRDVVFDLNRRAKLLEELGLNQEAEQLRVEAGRATLEAEDRETEIGERYDLRQFDLPQLEQAIQKLHNEKTSLGGDIDFLKNLFNTERVRSNGALQSKLDSKINELHNKFQSIDARLLFADSLVREKKSSNG